VVAGAAATTAAAAFDATAAFIRGAAVVCGGVRSDGAKDALIPMLLSPPEVGGDRPLQHQLDEGVIQQDVAEIDDNDLPAKLG